MVVGTHFYQTHPQFMSAFLATPRVRFVLNPDGVYHPKVYLFEKPRGRWECVIGSMNFTHGGLSENDEVAVLISEADREAEQALGRIRAAINGYWEAAKALTTEDLEVYRAAWARKQQLQKNLRGRFGSPTDNHDDRGAPPLTVPLLRMTWTNYFRVVQSERLPAPYERGMESRLPVIRKAKELFARYTQLKRMDPDERKMIAGLMAKDSVNYMIFGSMRGDGTFWQAVNENDRHLSAALDSIPATGDVTRKAYLAFITEFGRAFTDGRNRLATATRLLAMKRPDTFVCLDARNKSGLCAAFGVRRDLGAEAYWDSVIERLRDAAWWNAPSPRSGVEREVWDARAAFLDAHFYDAKDMPTAETTS